MRRWTAIFVMLSTAVSAQSPPSKPAEPAVATANQAVESRLPFADRQDFEDANSGFIGTIPDPADPERYAFREYMGGPHAVIARARDDFKAGTYRWVAEVMERVVFADPANQEARGLAADAFEQLGYLAEAAPWRNAYLLGAQELRTGIRLINWRFTDTRESLASTLAHGALTSIDGKTDARAVATVTTTRSAFEGVILGQRALAEAIEHNDIATSGDVEALSDLWALLVAPGTRE